MTTNNFISASRTTKKMNNETDKKELNPTKAYEPTEEGYDPNKEKKAHIGWIIFFSTMIVLIIAAVIVIKALS